MKNLLIVVILFITQVLYPQQNEKWITYFEKSNFKGTPDYAKSMEYFQKLSEFSGFAKLETFGISPQGRELKVLIVSKDKKFTPVKFSDREKPVVLIVNGIHSGEIEGKDASMLLLREILVTKEKENLLDSLNLLVVPIFNVDGHERKSKYNRINQNGPEEMGWRTTAQNLNLNRDWLKADAPEMQAMLKLYAKWLPDFLIDTHTTDGADYQYTITYAVEKFANIDNGLAKMLKEKFMPFVDNKVREKGFLIHQYIGRREYAKGLDGGITDWAATPRFSQGYAAVQNRPGLLIETHMIKPYKDRVYSTKALLEATLGFVNSNSSLLLNLNRNADKNSIRKYALKKDYLPVKFKTDDSYVLSDFKGYDYYWDTSFVSGTKKLVYTKNKKDLKLKFYNNVITTDSVKLPNVYLIPKEWNKLVKIMKLHGIFVVESVGDSVQEVTRYRFKNVNFAQFPYEGRQTVDFDYDTYQEKLTVPAGTFYVPTNQRTVKVIANFLEPKSDDSFVRWGFLNTTFERKEYFENYVMEKLAAEMLAANPELKKEFETKLKNDEDFRKSPQKRLNFFYERTPYFDNHYRVYPIMRIN